MSLPVFAEHQSRTSVSINDDKQVKQPPLRHPDDYLKHYIFAPHIEHPHSKVSENGDVVGLEENFFMKMLGAFGRMD